MRSHLADVLFSGAQILKAWVLRSLVLRVICEESLPRLRRQVRAITSRELTDQKVESGLDPFGEAPLPRLRILSRLRCKQ